MRLRGAVAPMGNAVRKLVLSLCVVAVSAAYVARAATERDGGVASLIDRLTFRPSSPQPLDLGAPSPGDDPLSVTPPQQSDLSPIPPVTSTDLALLPPTTIDVTGRSEEHTSE